MIRYLVVAIDSDEDGEWIDFTTNAFLKKGDIITLPNGKRFKVMYVEGKAFNGKRD